MKILIADDEPDTLVTYQIALKARNHDVVITRDGKECLQIYNQELLKTQSTAIITEMNDIGIFDDVRRYLPFDVVILDHLMPIIGGMEVAKEILDKNPNQRIVFVSAYVKETLEESVKYLLQPVELIEKPLEIRTFVDKIEKSHHGSKPHTKLITNSIIRDKIDIVASILELAMSPTSIISKYTVSYIVNLSYPHLKEYLNLLLDNNLLYFQNSKFKITDKGISFLDLYNKIRELLSSSD
jgi:two-component system cell cycle response regulator CpdR